jgi:hypothetical protein
MIRKRHIVYWALSVGSLALLGIDGPRGGLLTTTPERGKVEPSSASGAPSVRGAPVFIWAGGGYHGGK